MNAVHLLAFVNRENECGTSGAQTVFLRDVTCPECLQAFERATIPPRERKPSQTMSVAEEGELISRQYSRLRNPQMRMNVKLESLRVQYV